MHESLGIKEFVITLKGHHGNASRRGIPDYLFVNQQNTVGWGRFERKIHLQMVDSPSRHVSLSNLLQRTHVAKFFP